MALYASGSTDGQSVENQLRELEAVASKEGWQVVERFIAGASQGPRVERIAPPSIDFAKAWSGVSST